MRTASWEASPGALAAFLNSTTATYMVDLFTFTLLNKQVVRYTSADIAVTVGGVSHGLGPIIKRGKTRQSVGISVDTLDVTLGADSSVTINGTPILAFIAAGGLDSARLSLDRAFAPAPGAAWVGTLGLFQGRVSDTKISRYEAALTVASDAELLNTMVPRNVYQPGCSNTLFDGACGLSKAAWSAPLTATGASDVARTSFATTTNKPFAFFNLGWLVGVTGANAGLGRTVKYSTTGLIITVLPWAQPVAAGDTFTGYAGCDKQQGTCNSTFSNLIRFRGQPYVPAPETIL